MLKSKPKRIFENIVNEQLVFLLQEVVPFCKLGGNNVEFFRY